MIAVPKSSPSGLVAAISSPAKKDVQTPPFADTYQQLSTARAGQAATQVVSQKTGKAATARSKVSEPAVANAGGTGVAGVAPAIGAKALAGVVSPEPEASDGQPVDEERDVQDPARAKTKVSSTEPGMAGVTASNSIGNTDVAKARHIGGGFTAVVPKGGLKNESLPGVAPSFGDEQVLATPEQKHAQAVVATAVQAQDFVAPAISSSSTEAQPSLVAQRQTASAKIPVQDEKAVASFVAAARGTKQGPGTSAAITVDTSPSKSQAGEIAQATNETVASVPLVMAAGSQASETTDHVAKRMISTEVASVEAPTSGLRTISTKVTEARRSGAGGNHSETASQANGLADTAAQAATVSPEIASTTLGIAQASGSTVPQAFGLAIPSAAGADQVVPRGGTALSPGAIGYSASSEKDGGTTGLAVTKTMPTTTDGSASPTITPSASSDDRTLPAEKAVAGSKLVTKGSLQRSTAAGSTSSAKERKAVAAPAEDAAAGTSSGANASGHPPTASGPSMPATAPIKDGANDHEVAGAVVQATTLPTVSHEGMSAGAQGTILPVMPAVPNAVPTQVSAEAAGTTTATPVSRQGTDHGLSPMTHTTLSATPTVLEVGVPGGTQGWLKIRAEIGEGGVVQASMSASTHAGQDALRLDLPAISAFLESEHVPVNLQVAHSPVSTAASEGGVNLGSSLGQSLNQDANSSASAGQRDANGMMAASDGSGASGRQQQDTVERTVPVGSSSSPSAAIEDADWVTPAGYGGGSMLNGGSWLNVIA